MLNLNNANYYFSEKGKVSTTPFKKTLFTAVSISTPAKGPLYTLVEGDGRQINQRFNQAVIQMNYMNGDSPIDDNMRFETTVDSSKPYSFYPLIKQLYGINDFIERQSWEWNSIFLNRITIYDKLKEPKTIIDDKKNDKAIMKAVEKFDLKTSVAKIMKDNKFINTFWSKHGTEYKISDETAILPGEQTFIALPDIESCYLLPSYTLRNIMSIACVTINLKYDKPFKPVNHKECKSIIDGLKLEDMKPNDENEEEPQIYYDGTSMEDILKLCIYVPQLIMIERALYDVDVTISVTVEKAGQAATLTIKKEEYRPDICFIDIISRLSNFMV